MRRVAVQTYVTIMSCVIKAMWVSRESASIIKVCLFSQSSNYIPGGSCWTTYSNFILFTDHWYNWARSQQNIEEKEFLYISHRNRSKVVACRDRRLYLHRAEDSTRHICSRQSWPTDLIKGIGYKNRVLAFEMSSQTKKPSFTVSQAAPSCCKVSLHHFPDWHFLSFSDTRCWNVCPVRSYSLSVHAVGFRFFIFPFLFLKR